MKATQASSAHLPRLGSVTISVEIEPLCWLRPSNTPISGPAPRMFKTAVLDLSSLTRSRKTG